MKCGWKHGNQPRIIRSVSMTGSPALVSLLPWGIYSRTQATPVDSSNRTEELMKALFAESCPLNLSNRRCCHRPDTRLRGGTTSNIPRFLESFLFLPNRSADPLYSSSSGGRRRYRDAGATHDRKFQPGHCCADWTSKPYLLKVSAAAAVLMNDKNCFAMSLFLEDLRTTQAC